MFVAYLVLSMTVFREEYPEDEKGGNEEEEVVCEEDAEGETVCQEVEVVEEIACYTD
jgi:hypothetical protein